MLCLSFEGFHEYVSVLLIPEKRQRYRAKDLMVLKKHIIANLELLLEWFCPVRTDHRSQAVALSGCQVKIHRATHRQCPCIISCSKPRIHQAEVFFISPVSFQDELLYIHYKPITETFR